MKVIKQIYKIEASKTKVWNALVSPKEIKAWSGETAKMDAKVNAEFSLWGGSIWGKNIEVVPEKKLVQEWFGGEWEKPSIMEIVLSEKAGFTDIKLVHKNVPPEEIKDFAAGWNDYYFGPMKEYLENK